MQKNFLTFLFLFTIISQLVSCALVSLRTSPEGYQHYRGVVTEKKELIRAVVQDAYHDMVALHTAEEARWERLQAARRRWDQEWAYYVDDCKRADRAGKKRPRKPEPKPQNEDRPIQLPAMMSGLYYQGKIYLSSSAKRVHSGHPYPADFPKALKDAMDACKVECGSSHRHGGACSEPMAWAVMVHRLQLTSLPAKWTTGIATFGLGPLDIAQNRAAHRQNPCADTDQGSGCRTLMAYVGSNLLRKRWMTDGEYDGHGSGGTPHRQSLDARDVQEDTDTGADLTSAQTPAPTDHTSPDNDAKGGDDTSSVQSAVEGSES